MIRRTLLASSVAALCCALPSIAAPFFLSIEYTGSANVGPLSFPQARISVTAKGVTDAVTVEHTSQGTVRTIPVAMVIHVEGAGALEIHNDIVFFVFSDAGFAGFGVSRAQASFMLAAPDALTGYDFTTSVNQGAILGSGGIPGQILNTVLGPISLGPGENGGFITAAVNPAPGGAAAMAVGCALASSGRRRAAKSG